MKELMLLIPLGSALLLTGCAGTETEFQCNATTSDTCMTMEQANEKAKLKEERSDAKPAAASCHDWLTEISERRRQTHIRCRHSQ